MPWVSMNRLGKERDFCCNDRNRRSPDISISEEGEETKYYDSHSRPPPPPQPFKFGYKRQPIDWRVLHGVDIERMVRCFLSYQDLRFESRHLRTLTFDCSAGHLFGPQADSTAGLDPLLIS